MKRVLMLVVLLLMVAGGVTSANAPRLAVADGQQGALTDDQRVRFMDGIDYLLVEVEFYAEHGYPRSHPPKGD